MKLPIHNARTAASKSLPTFNAISEARGFVPNVYAVFGGQPNQNSMKTDIFVHQPRSCGVVSPRGDMRPYGKKEISHD